MNKSDIGLIGLAVMGENLALNMENKGFTVSVYNRNFPGEEGVVDRFVNGRGKGKKFIGTHSVEEFVNSIERPCKIMMMIRAGNPVDEMIQQLLPYLSEGDVIIDGGNSDFHDTERRVKEVESNGFYFIGTGISGGEQGALNGPSIMPGGSAAAWPLVRDILQAIAAKLEDGTPCCQWIGKGGAGHFVKTVHNGIEYGDMQLITEAYALLKHRKQMNNQEMSDVFRSWNDGELDSYLIDITSQILRFKDEDDKYLLDKIRDVAGQKGTGKWASVAAMDENDPLTLITEAVYARLLSALGEERAKAHGIFPPFASLASLLETSDVEQALYASKLVSYAQGFSLLRRASTHYNWDLDLATIAKIWRKGCIIRSVFLQKITDAYLKNPGLENLLFDEFFTKKIKASSTAWRKVVSEGALTGLALPAMSSALAYFDGLRTLQSPANLIQAQRDYFGAHTYERTDREPGIFFHTDWTGAGGNTTSGTYNR
ncbi:6-phosphogluconate dehydrogenase [Parabacteroides sp. PF5-5]|uniref:decarboxylating NADP(+)-dependent phosphogluconate dehydrogenase n=1 Tax=unclassified Parabacteroides TaxID=2649774 RepID=UPI002472E8E2|nr:MULTISPECIES: decarboxylating NADP(+)-dependent phosphogluconate dehydrogenase [unclassified Parabacteroides]MDH6304411.1 6-phosphogluconate dehydrogenase [Parabacteroides sp. PH5-39]MDH6315436.1 6-phosphogluconate dehydrogenase [Parabacteroides sp. PF5-13]MDH6319070.1 6-phosphogluconate dehydrogenase [Parabacteroides sp. PH5-13]MDH6322800.1 6-phosphogluconate dehydrogenase [Parabacteroides sp. PH5-8]MDH6326628.1 6-phosphogluconate dehydrogenase [Parabacteroides sp. PH5-41]